MDSDGSSSSDSSTLPPWRKQGSVPPPAVVKAAAKKDDNTADSDESVPEWKKKFNSMRAKSTSPPKTPTAEPAGQQEEGEAVPEWMQKLHTMKAKKDQSPEDSKKSASKEEDDANVPEWKKKLKAMQSKASASPSSSADSKVVKGETPEGDNVPEWKKKFNEMKQRESISESSEQVAAAVEAAAKSEEGDEEEIDVVESEEALLAPDTAEASNASGTSASHHSESSGGSSGAPPPPPSGDNVVEEVVEEEVVEDDIGIAEEEIFEEEYASVSERDNIYDDISYEEIADGSSAFVMEEVIDDDVIEEVVDDDEVIEEVIEDADGTQPELSLKSSTSTPAVHPFTSQAVTPAPDDETEALAQLHRPVPQTFQPSASNSSFSAYKPPGQIVPMLPDPEGERSESSGSVQIEPEGAFRESKVEIFRDVSPSPSSSGDETAKRHNVELLTGNLLLEDEDEQSKQSLVSEAIPEAFLDEEQQEPEIVVRQRDYRDEDNPWLMALVCLLFLGLLVAAVLLLLALLDAPPFDDDDNGDSGNGFPTMPPTRNFVGNQPTSPMDPYIPGQCPVAGQLNPNILAQCGCNGKITTLESDVRAKYQALLDTFILNIYPTWSYPIESCEPTNMALVWLATGSQEDETDLLQRYVLSALYYGNDGTKWRNQDNWLGDIDICTWYGVACTNQLIALLALEDNNVSGSVR